MIIHTMYLGLCLNVIYLYIIIIYTWNETAGPILSSFSILQHVFFAYMIISDSTLKITCIVSKKWTPCSAEKILV